MSLPWMSLRQHVLRLATRPQQPVNFFTTSHRRLQYLRHDLPLSNQLKTLRNHRLQTRPQTRLNSSRPNPDPISNLNSANPAKAAKDTSLSARLKRLSKEYGWSAFGVYLALSALDFPFCFLAVRWLGVERIGRYEQAVIGSLWHVLEIPFPGLRTNGESAASSTNSETVSEGVVRDGAEAGLIKKENACKLSSVT